MRSADKLILILKHAWTPALFFVLLISACGLVPSRAVGESYLAWAANSCGGERMVGSNTIAEVSVGQLTIGENASGPRMAGLGVLSAEQAPTLVVASPGAAKTHPDGARVALEGMVVTSEPGSFSGRIYAEAPDRSSGIALVGGLGEAPLAHEGYRVNVVGGVFTLNGERVMLNPMVALLTPGDPLDPLMMNNRSIGGTAIGVPPSGQQGVVNGYGLSNVGLLVKTPGLVIDNTSPDCIVINDGSIVPSWSNGLKVAKNNLAPIPEIGSHVLVVGIAGVQARGSLLDSTVLPRSAGDVTVLRLPQP